MVKTFMSSDDFKFLKVFEENYEKIRDEYLNVANNLIDWPERGLHNGLWKAFGIMFCGNKVPTRTLTPYTTSLVDQIPNLWIAGFSVLKPGCRIIPHVGYTDRVYRAHIGLICDGQAFIQVGNDQYHWKNGEAVVFDDTQLHFAQNDGKEDRVILLVDFMK